jgi:hypothetical protein
MLENGTHPIFQPGPLEQSKLLILDLQFFSENFIHQCEISATSFFVDPCRNRQKFAYYENIFTIACEEQFIIFLDGFSRI